MRFKNEEEFVSNLNIYRNFGIEKFLKDAKRFNLGDGVSNEVLNAFLLVALGNLQQRLLPEESVYDEGFIYLKKIIKSLLQEEKQKVEDFIYIHSGIKSDVYKIGSKILKLSYQKIQPSVPKSKYNIESITGEIKVDGFSVVFDIMDYLEPLCEIKMSQKTRKDIVYKIYKAYRKEGKIWVDPKPENVGRLLKDNKINLNSVLYLKEEGDILKKGEYANFDLEFIYGENDFDYEYLAGLIYMDNYDEMEERYQKELKSQKN